MDRFEKALVKLGDAVISSGSPELREAFIEYMQEFQASLKAYLQFLSLMQAFEPSTPQGWDVEVAVKH